ncbi:MAG: TetR/AcrR family transcriptional regulator [Saprospiraceae bacterium]|nr:TetR/AcrR family transcriptional regulator [Saprospiraceae bacterium]
MKTKDKILQMALQQFNERGVEQVSIRSISNALGISAGNLTYHYKNTDKIIYALYLQLVDELGRSIEQVINQSPDIQWLYEATAYNCHMMWKYRFLLIDFVAITRRVTDIRDHFRQLVKMRQWQIRQAINEMVELGLFIPEWQEGMYDKYILRMIIMSDAWIPDAQIHFQGEEEEIIPFYTELIVSSIQPYLTPAGQAAYLAVLGPAAPKKITGYPDMEETNTD